MHGNCMNSVSCRIAWLACSGLEFSGLWEYRYGSLLPRPMVDIGHAGWGITCEKHLVNPAWTAAVLKYGSNSISECCEFVAMYL